MNWIGLIIIIVLGCIGATIGTAISWMLGIAEWTREVFVTMYAITLTFIFWTETWKE